MYKPREQDQKNQLSEEARYKDYKELRLYWRSSKSYEAVRQSIEDYCDA